MREVEAGEFLTHRCPSGSTPLVNRGDYLGDIEHPLAYVVDVVQQEVVLGLLRAGELSFEGLCSVADKVEVFLNPPDTEEISADLLFLQPFKLGYPWWAYALIVVLILFLLAALVGAWFYFSRRRAAVRSGVERRRRSLWERYEIYLQKVKERKILMANDHESASFLYGEGIRRLRILLQKHMKFKAPGATSNEFIAEFKVQMVKNRGLYKKDEIVLIESLFMQAKQVVYAGESPDPENRRAFFNNLQTVIGVLKKKESEASPSSQAQGGNA